MHGITDDRNAAFEFGPEFSCMPPFEVLEAPLLTQDPIQMTMGVEDVLVGRFLRIRVVFDVFAPRSVTVKKKGFQHLPNWKLPEQLKQTVLDYLYVS